MRKQKRTKRVAPLRRTTHLVLSLPACMRPRMRARDVGDPRISVTAVAGDVEVTMAGQAANVAPDSTVLLPERIVTGHDGTLGLTQAGTNISVSNDTDVEIPAEAVDGNLDRPARAAPRQRVLRRRAARSRQAPRRDAAARGRHQGHAIQRCRAAGQHDDLVVRRPARDPHAGQHRRRAVERRRDRDPLAHRRRDPRRRHGRRPRRRAANSPASRRRRRRSGRAAGRRAWSI